MGRNDSRRKAVRCGLLRPGRKGVVPFLVMLMISGASPGLGTPTGCGTEEIRSYVDSVRWPGGPTQKALDWNGCFDSQDATAAAEMQILDCLSRFAPAKSEEKRTDAEACLFKGVNGEDLNAHLKNWRISLHMDHLSERKRFKEPAYGALLATTALVILDRSSALGELGVHPVGNLRDLLGKAPNWDRLEKELRSFPKIPIWRTEGSSGQSLAELNQRALQVNLQSVGSQDKGKAQLQAIAGELPKMADYWDHISGSIDTLIQMQWTVAVPAGCESAICKSLQACKEKRDAASWQALTEEIEAGLGELNKQWKTLKKDLPQVDGASLEKGFATSQRLVSDMKKGAPYAPSSDKQIEAAVLSMESSSGKIERLKAVAAYRNAVVRLARGEILQAKQTLGGCQGAVEEAPLAAACMVAGYYEHGEKGANDFCSGQTGNCKDAAMLKEIEDLMSMLGLEGRDLRSGNPEPHPQVTH